jgi:hypothetical protein
LKPSRKAWGKTLEDIATGNDFLNKTPIAQEIEARISKRD